VSRIKELVVKIVYLVLAHNCPRHLQRLVGALSSRSSAFFVHIDKKVDTAAFREAVGDAVSFTRERVAVHWGDFSQVEAIRALIREALADARKFDRFVLLSGTDYPVRPQSYIAEFFARNREAQFINIVQMPSVSVSKPLSRLTDFQPAPATTALSKLARKIAARIGIKPRQRDYKEVFDGLVPYAGSTWWAFTRDACEYIEEFAQARPALVDFFRNTVCPDEMFFHTVLGNSNFASDMQRHVTYTDWTAGGASPAYMSMAHVELFRSTRTFPADGQFGGGEMLFARKFSDDLESVVAALDRLLLEDGDGVRRPSRIMS
jgi:hypothetical protein